MVEIFQANKEFENYENHNDIAVKVDIYEHFEYEQQNLFLTRCEITLWNLRIPLGNTLRMLLP